MTTKKNSINIRADPEWVKLVNDIIGVKLVNQQKKVSPRRITLAMSRQYKIYPQLRKELETSDLK